jgi:hypothetical protein
VQADPRALLDRWREEGADRLDPVRFHFLDALARRTAGHSGQARRILDDRLAGLVEVFASDLERAVGRDGAAAAASHAGPHRAAPGPLAALVDHIAGHAAVDTDGPVANAVATWRASYPDLALVDDFREIWARVSTERQLRQSMAQVPQNPGPLNSSHLVHRSLSAMRELSPGYLRQFLSYLDALSWMDRMNGGGAVAGGKEAPRATGARKGARGKAR